MCTLEDHLRIEEILDSGADVSLLPSHLAPKRATSSKKNNTRLQDAQEKQSHLCWKADGQLDSVSL